MPSEPDLSQRVFVRTPHVVFQPQRGAGHGLLLVLEVGDQGGHHIQKLVLFPRIALGQATQPGLHITSIAVHGLDPFDVDLLATALGRDEAPIDRGGLLHVPVACLEASPEGATSSAQWATEGALVRELRLPALVACLISLEFVRVVLRD